MTIIKKISDLQNFLRLHRKDGQKIGFAPTMGALHPGHISLITESQKSNGLTVSSIFINPVQFNDPKDYEKYPITLENDILLLEKAGCNVLFLPSVSEVYPDGTTQQKKYELGYLESVLEGEYRPGHFQGVCMVIERLLDIVKPDNLYLGQKDYQQCMVIKKLTELTGLDQTVHTRICPTLREPDGLAMSSRNMRLSETERKNAGTIYKTLQLIKEGLGKNELRSLKKEAKKILSEKGFKPDYVEIADASTLQLVNDWDGKQKLVALIAAFLNEVRLIDNLPLN